MKQLLIKNNTLNLPHEKWYRNLAEDTIFINEDNYTLSLTDNKRELLFKKNQFVDTVLHNGKWIK